MRNRYQNLEESAQAVYHSAQNPEAPEQIDIALPSAVSTTKKEKFIPVTRFELMHKLKRAESWPPGQYENASEVLDQLNAWRHHSYYERLNILNENYIEFCPDRDTVSAQKLSEEDKYKKRKTFVTSLTTILEQANYEKISEQDLSSYFEAQGPYELNLKVDLSEFDEVLAYYRGSDIKIYHKRTFRTLFLKKDTISIPIFQSLFLLLKLKPEHVRVHEIMKERQVDEKKAGKILKKLRKHLPVDICPSRIYLKMFKNIPQSDLEMLFPNTKIEFRLFDKIKFWFTAGSGTLTGIFATATKLLAATNPITLIIAIFGFGGIIFRQIMGFFNQRNRYMMVLAQNLYFHSLANNRGALTLLLDRAEEEDIKEEILLYAYLTHHPISIHERAKAKETIEMFLNKEFGVTIDYDFDDALRRLRQDGLAFEDEQGLLTVLKPDEAYARLAQLRIKSLSIDTLISQK